MSLLSQVTKGKIEKPHLILPYGPDGVGKSSFAADSPCPIFLGTEKGTSNLDVARFPAPKNLKGITDAITELIKEKHDYKTLVIDSLDWVEPLVWERVCEIKKVDSIEDIGFGKGYLFAQDLWRELIGQITELQENRHMNVILIAHSQVKTFQDPTTQSGYDRYQLKLNEKVAAIFREYVDVVGFANFEVSTKKDDKDKTRAYGDGARYLYTERRPGFDAKNRFGLPFAIPLSWNDYVEAFNSTGSEDATQVRNNIEELLKLVKDQKVIDSVTAVLADASAPIEKLNKYLNRLRTLVAA